MGGLVNSIWQTAFKHRSRYVVSPILCHIGKLSLQVWLAAAFNQGRSPIAKSCIHGRPVRSRPVISLRIWADGIPSQAPNPWYCTFRKYSRAMRWSFETPDLNDPPAFLCQKPTTLRPPGMPLLYSFGFCANALTIGNPKTPKMSSSRSSPDRASGQCSSLSEWCTNQCSLLNGSLELSEEFRLVNSGMINSGSKPLDIILYLTWSASGLHGLEHRRCLSKRLDSL